MLTLACSGKRFLPSIVLALLIISLSACGPKTARPPRAGSGRDISSAQGQKIVQTATKQTGIRYKFGGDTPRGFDCSGLVWWSYRENGIKVPRVTGDQSRAGRSVSLKQAYSGDILVFSINSGLHTAIYTGNGEFIHSPSSGKRVRKDKVDDPYWKSRLRDIRRVSA
jgi:cell wall-associated NlpC family hydrolase